MSHHLSPAARHAVDEARAVMQSKRASCCRHGVNRDCCSECVRDDDRRYRQAAVTPTAHKKLDDLLPEDRDPAVAAVRGEIATPETQHKESA